jgi:hypothetical protein
MSKINDEFSDRTDVSRQRRYQLRKRRDGRCVRCGRPTLGKIYCEEHRQEANVRGREEQRARIGAKRRYKSAESYTFRCSKNKKR